MLTLVKNASGQYYADGVCVASVVEPYDALPPARRNGFPTCYGDDPVILSPQTNPAKCLPSAKQVQDAATAVASAGALGAQTSFDQTLDLYKRTLTEFKASGNAAYKSASDVAKKWLDDYLKTMEDKADKNKKDIEDFVKNYDKSGSQLTELKNDMKMIRKEGPELQTLYETEKESEVEEEVDYTVYYTKGAVLAGVLGLIAVSSFI